jgi:hypothetical protein
MFVVFEQAMDTIIPGWEDGLLSTCSDGARSMLGRICGIVTRIAERSMLPATLRSDSCVVLTSWILLCQRSCKRFAMRTGNPLVLP